MDEKTKAIFYLGQVCALDCAKFGIEPLRKLDEDSYVCTECETHISDPVIAQREPEVLGCPFCIQKTLEGVYEDIPSQVSIPAVRALMEAVHDPPSLDDLGKKNIDLARVFCDRSLLSADWQLAYALYKTLI